MKIAMCVVTIMLALTLTAGFAHADSIVYSFVGQYIGPNNNPVPASFTLTVLAPLAGTGATGFHPDLSFTPGASLVCNGCAFVNFYEDAIAHGLGPLAADAFGYVVVNSLGRLESFFYFDPNAVLTNGTYHDLVPVQGQDGTLTVSGVPAQVPEPSTLSLLVLGLIVIGGRAYSQRRLT